MFVRPHRGDPVGRLSWTLRAPSAGSSWLCLGTGLMLWDERVDIKENMAVGVLMLYGDGVDY